MTCGHVSTCVLIGPGLIYVSLPWVCLWPRGVYLKRLSQACRAVSCQFVLFSSLPQYNSDNGTTLSSTFYISFVENGITRLEVYINHF